MDNNEEIGTKIESKLMPYRFWLFAALSAFLTVTFIYYLPLRFQHQGEAHEEEMQEPVHGGAHEAQYHEESEIREGLVVEFFAKPRPVSAGTSTWLSFGVHEKPSKFPVLDLEIEHDKLMHVIGVRNDMEEFFHIHPEQVIGFIGEPEIREGPGFKYLATPQVLPEDSLLHIPFQNPVYINYGRK